MDVGVETIFVFLYMGRKLAHLANRGLRLNRPWAAAMLPYVKLLWPLVIVRPHRSRL